MRRIAVRAVGPALLLVAVPVAAGTACSSFDAAGNNGTAVEAGTADGPRVPPLVGACDPRAKFDAPRELRELNDTVSQAVPRLTADELTIVYQVGVPVRIWSATRARRDDPFGSAQPIVTLDPVAELDDADPWLSPDGKTLIFSSLRADAISRLYVAHSGFGGFTRPGELVIGGRNIATSQPFVSADGLLFFNSDRSTPDGEGGAAPKPPHLFAAPYDGDAAVGLPVRIELGVDGVDAGTTYNGDLLPVMSADLGFLYVAAQRAGGRGGYDIYVSERTSGLAFGPLTLVDELSSAGNDAPGWLSPDGCRFYFSSNRLGSNDLYVAERRR
jgi:hypothetical protein